MESNSPRRKGTGRKKKIENMTVTVCICVCVSYFINNADCSMDLGHMTDEAGGLSSQNPQGGQEADQGGGAGL